jgi:hypothetical protein
MVLFLAAVYILVNIPPATSKPWQGLPLPIDSKVRALFNASVRFKLGNGEKIKFWTDPWLQNLSLCDHMPDLYAVCTRCKLSTRDALSASKWSKHFRQFLPANAIVQFVELWGLLDHIVLDAATPDSVSLRWTTDGVFTVASAYKIQFQGAAHLAANTLLWKSDTTLRCKIFS